MKIGFVIFKFESFSIAESEISDFCFDNWSWDGVYNHGYQTEYVSVLCLRLNDNYKAE